MGMMGIRYYCRECAKDQFSQHICCIFLQQNQYIYAPLRARNCKLYFKHQLTIGSLIQVYKINIFIWNSDSTDLVNWARQNLENAKKTFQGFLDIFDQVFALDARKRDSFEIEELKMRLGELVNDIKVRIRRFGYFKDRLKKHKLLI